MTYPIVPTAAQTRAGLRGVNREMRLYLIPCGSGISCLGFDVAARETAAVAEWLKRPELMPPARKGTVKAWRAYQAAMAAGAAHNRATGERCPAALTRQLIGLEGRRVEIVTPSGERSRFTVGKSSGWFPVHLEIKPRDSTGGCAVYLPDGSRVHVV